MLAIFTIKEPSNSFGNEVPPVMIALRLFFDRFLVQLRIQVYPVRSIYIFQSKYNYLISWSLLYLLGWLVHIWNEQKLEQVSSVVSQIWSLVSTVEENLPRTELILTRWTCLYFFLFFTFLRPNWYPQGQPVLKMSFLCQIAGYLQEDFQEGHHTIWRARPAIGWHWGRKV